MKLSGDIRLMNSPKKKDVICSFSADRPSAFHVKWSIIYDPARRMTVNGSVLEIAPGANEGKALARCYLLYGNHMTTSIDYRLLILPTGVQPEPQIIPERSFLWLDESVSFKLRLKVKHLSRSVQKCLKSSLTIMAHITGRRSHGLKGNVLYPVALHQPGAENWTSFQIHYDLFYSSYRFTLQKHLEFRARPSVHFNIPECHLEAAEYYPWYSVSVTEGNDVLDVLNEDISWPFSHQRQQGVYLCTAHLGETYVHQEKTQRNQNLWYPLGYVTPETRLISGSGMTFTCMVNDWRLPKQTPVSIWWERRQDEHNLFRSRNASLFSVKSIDEVAIFVYDCVIMSGETVRKIQLRVLNVINITDTLDGENTDDPVLNVGDNKQLECDLLPLGVANELDGVWKATVNGAAADIVEIDHTANRAKIRPRNPPGYYTQETSFVVTCVLHAKDDEGTVI
ncbi:hypothetical protein CRM22_011143, partial [Opisthorchis felineus]